MKYASVDSVQSRKPGGLDAITAETIKQNRTWITPVVEITLSNIQRSKKIPKSQIRGTVVFIQNPNPAIFKIADL